MPNANWSNPTLTSTYTNFLSEVKNRDEDLALQFDGTTSTNIPTNAIRWDSSAGRWKKWNGTAWGELTSLYALTGLSTTGNASIGGTFGVTGAATFSSTLGVTGALTGSSTISGTALIPTSATIPANGVYLPGANTVGIATGGVAAALVDDNGDLSIYNAAGTFNHRFANQPTANRTVTLPDADVTLVSGTMVPTTGTGATGTWGISITGNAGTVGGLSLQASGVNIGGSQVARSDPNGYVWFNYVNSNTANNENPSVSQVLVTNGSDNYYRKASISHFATAVRSNASGSWGINITGSSASCSGNAATATQLSTASGSAPSYSARAWVNFNGQGAVSIRASGNVSSITDNGVGDYTVNFSTGIVDSNYCVCGTSADYENAPYILPQTSASYSTGSVRVISYNYVGNPYDSSAVAVAIIR